MGIFGETAPAYFAAGINVMPVKGKRAFLPSWQTWCQQPVPVETQKQWLIEHGGCNIGLPLGPASGLVAVDIDTDDEQVLDVFRKVLPKTPWERRGKKGFVMLFKHTNERTFHLYEMEDGSESERKKSPIFDFLATGSQVVIPPSIHPDTLQPYSANCELLDVLDRIPALPAGFEDLIRAGLLGIGRRLAPSGTSKVGGGARLALTERISMGQRDTMLTRQAGYHAYDVLEGKMSLKDALVRIRNWAGDQIDKAWGDEIDPDKAPQKVIEFILKDVLGPKQRILPAGWDDGLSEEDKKELGLGDITEANRMLSASEVRVYLEEAMEAGKLHPGHPDCYSTVDKIVCDIARSDKLNPIEESMLVKQVSDATGRKITVAALRAQIKDLRRGAVEGTDHTMVAEAVLEEVQRNGEIRYHNSMIWQWGGSHWSELKEEELLCLISKNYGHQAAAKRFSDHVGVLKVIKNQIAKPLAPLEIAGVNFVNGFLTEDVQLVEHAPDFGATYTLPYAYQPELVGKATRWVDMLLTYWDGDYDIGDKMTSLQEAMGATLFGKMPEMGQAVCLLGEAAAGKSQVIKVIEGMIPQNKQTAASPTTWHDKFVLAGLSQSLLNICGEIPDKKAIESAVFKQVITGDKVEAQYKFMPAFSFYPKAAHWFASNSLPRTSDDTEGFTRRWLFLTFNKSLDPKHRIANYAEMVLEEERDAIAAWAVQGWVHLKERGASSVLVPASGKRKERELLHQTNTVRFFMDTLRDQGRLIVGEDIPAEVPGKYTMVTSLYNTYKTFCIAEVAVTQVNLQKFRSTLDSMCKGGEWPIKLVSVPSPVGVGMVDALEGVVLNDKIRRKAA